MQNKMFLFNIIISCLFCLNVFAETEVDIVAEDLSAESVAEYKVDGSVFQQITTLEQEKVLMQLEKERAQLDLELDKLAAEKIKLNMEIDTLSGRAEQQQQELDNERAKLEAEAEKIARERENLLNAPSSESGTTVQKPVQSAIQESVSSMYKLVNVLGAGSQLQATLEDLSTGQKKRVSVGKKIGGFMVKSISLYEGVVFEKDGETQTLNIANR